MTTVAGLLLAAGAGRRFGQPKALVELGGEPLLVRGVRVLAAGGCAPVLAVLGAQADAAAAVLRPGTATVVHAANWSEGMAASLRAGLQAATGLDPVPDAVLVHLVDLPDVTAAIVARLAARARHDALARATYRGTPGHPVLLGRRWWPELIEAVHGDRGARDWLAARTGVQPVECADLASGADADTPAQLRRHGASN